MPKEKLTFTDKKIEEIKMLFSTFGVEFGSIGVQTYSSAFELIRCNKEDYDFYNFYMKFGFREFFGIGILLTRFSMYFSFETPKDEAVLVQVRLAK